MKTLQIIIFLIALLFSFYELFTKKIYNNEDLRKKGYKTLLVISIIFFADKLYHLF